MEAMNITSNPYGFIENDRSFSNSSNFAGDPHGFIEDNGSASNSTNFTIPLFEEWTNKQVALTLVFGVMTVTTIIANAFVLYIFIIGRRRLRTPTNLLLANLAVADLLVGLVIMPILASATILGGKWIFGDAACQAFDYVHFLLCGASMWSMIGVGAERFIGVTRPLQYKNIVTRNRTIILIAGIWGLALSLTSGPLTMWPKAMSGISTVCFVNLGKPFLFFVSFFAYWFPITGTLIIYFLVYRSAVTPFTKSLGVASTSKQKSDELTGAKQKQTRLAKSIAIVTGTLFLFYAPVFLIFTIKAFDSPYFSVDLLFLTGWIRYSCSTVNPFLYGLAVPGYRQVIRERFFGIPDKGGLLDGSLALSNASGSGGGESTLPRGM